MFYQVQSFNCTTRTWWRRCSVCRDRPGTNVLQRRVRDVYRSHDSLRHGRKELDWPLWHLHRHRRDRRWVLYGESLNFWCILACQRSESCSHGALSCFLTRRGRVWHTEQKQPVWEEPCGAAGTHDSLHCILLDLSQHCKWRSSGSRRRNRPAGLHHPQVELSTQRIQVCPSHNMPYVL